MDTPLLQVRDLYVEFRSRGGVTYAVNGVDFDLHAGETLGVVGESGSGKSVTCGVIMGLLPKPPTWVNPEASAIFDGKNLLSLGESELRRIRGNIISMIFQDPMTSLNRSSFTAACHTMRRANLPSVSWNSQASRRQHSVPIVSRMNFQGACARG